VRVLHLYKDAYPFGGIDRHIHSIRQALPDIRQDVLVCGRSWRTTTRSTPYGEDVLIAELPRRVLSTPLAPTYPAHARRLSRGAVVHLHMPNPLSELSILGLPRSHPLVITHHADVYRQRVLLPLYRPLVRTCLRRADTVLVSSTRLRDTSPALLDAGVRAETVPFAVDLPRWERGAAPEHEVLAIRARHGGPFVLAVGRLVAYKGFDRLVEMARDLPWPVVIVGDGPLRESLEEQARAAGVANRVHLVGRLGDDALRAYFAAAELFVLPSVNPAEAFGIVLLEAQAAGLPVVATDTGTGTVEAFAPGESGTAVPAGDDAALRSAIAELISDPVLRARYGAAGRARVAGRNSPAALAAKMGPIYRRLARAVTDGELPAQ